MSETKVEVLDLRGVVCPINFVEVKLKLEELETGECLEVWLDGGEPVENVPRSVKEEQHKVLALKKEQDYWRLLIEKVTG